MGFVFAYSQTKRNRMDSQKPYDVMTGAEFNKQMPNIKMYKALHSSLVHYGYKYEPNALNSLDKTCEQFNPDPNCQPGGLYFCTETDILRLIFLNLPKYQLIAPVEIPDHAQVSVAEYKIKTDVLVLGNPVTLEAFYSSGAARNISIDFLKELGYWGWNYQREWNMVKDLYALVPNSFDTELKAKLLYFAVIHYEQKLFPVAIEDMRKTPEWDQIKKRHLELLAGSDVRHRQTIAWFRMLFPQYASLIHV